jgi:hypothetical protein
MNRELIRNEDYILGLNKEISEGKINGEEYYNFFRELINHNKHKKELEKFTVLDLYQFKYGYPQAVTINLLTGINLKSINEYLQSCEEYSKFSNPKKQNLFRRVHAFEVDHVWHIDLMEFTELFSQHNNGIKYCLVCIDVLSKFVWCEPVKFKSAEELMNILLKIFSGETKCLNKSGEVTPNIIFVDGEKGIWSNQVQNMFNDKNIKCKLASGMNGACVVERVISSIKENMFKYFHE